MVVVVLLSGLMMLFLQFETTNHCDHDHIGYTDFALSSKCSACKCQDCKAKPDGVTNAINALIAFAKELISKKGVIPSKRISYPYTPLEIKVDKRRRKELSKASSSIKKAKLYYQQQPKVSRIKKCLINIIKGFSIPAGLPWHLVNKVYISINCGDEFHWVLVVDVLKQRCIRVYDSISGKRHFGRSSEIQKMVKILPTYLYISGFLDQKVRTHWSAIETYRDKLCNPFDVEYVEEISQQPIGSLGIVLPPWMGPGTLARRANIMDLHWNWTIENLALSVMRQYLGGPLKIESRYLNLLRDVLLTEMTVFYGWNLK
ncbi:hypothetical protein BC332_25305 [Capsicum chinense]|nr:hypothetical protein BC332_25305 [Capsicum chinense]